MAAASYFNEGLSPPHPHKPTFTAEMYNLPSPNSSYNGSHQTNDEPLNPAGYAPSTAVPQIEESKSVSRLGRRKFEKLKRWIRILKTVSESLTTLFTVIMFGIMLYVNITYYKTKGTLREGRNPWPQHGTKLWPTLMLLVASGLTLAMSLVILFSYCCCWKKTERSWKITTAKYIVHILAWIIISVVYKYEKSLHGNNIDLWGWSCSTKARDLQVAFDGVVDFSKLCKVQSSSWHTSIAEFVAKIIFAVGYFIVKRQEKGAKQNLADNVGGAATGMLPDDF